MIELNAVSSLQYVYARMYNGRLRQSPLIRSRRIIRLVLRPYNHQVMISVRPLAQPAGHDDGALPSRLQRLKIAGPSLLTGGAVK